MTADVSNKPVYDIDDEYEITDGPAWGIDFTGHHLVARKHADLLRETWAVVHPYPHQGIENLVIPLAMSGPATPAPILRRTDDEVGQLFGAYCEEWKKASATSASMTDHVLHPAYQRIIGLGPQVLRFIIDELRREPDQWFWALTAIVGSDVASGAPSFAEAANRWLEWADAQGHAW